MSPPGDEWRFGDLAGGDPYPVTTTTCSWCHAANPASASTCGSCGHDAQKPRMACTCGQPGCQR